MGKYFKPHKKTLWKYNLKQFVNDTTIGHTHTNTNTHSHCRRRKCENENNNEREKENELWSMRTANCELATLQRKSVLPRSARAVTVCTWGASKWHKNDCVCVWVWVGVLSFGTRHAYNKPQMCRLSGQKCMQHISQFERGQRTKQTQGTLSWLWLWLWLCNLNAYT